MRKKIKYPKPRAFRVKEEIRQKLKEGRIKSGLSWNKYILTLIDKDYKEQITYPQA